MKTAEDYLKESIQGCTCDEAYTKRRLTAPDCAWCNNADGIIEAMNLYAESKILEDRKDCAEKAKTLVKEAEAVKQQPDGSFVPGLPVLYYQVNKASILDRPMPDLK